ncbi:MAG: 4-phosphopantetheinyl transferase [Blastococcus sp.]|jgi:4'-phosphopantetheinyl transferase|nr:4-phosphopantetheinyl transferase [Blastococcus sp.]
MLPVDVDVRLVDLAAGDDDVARAESSLTPAELARARRGTAPVHRRRVLLRAALREALGAELRMDPRAVPLATTTAGRPYVAAEGTSVDVSCSASGALGLVAVGRSCRIGIDVEHVAPWSPDVLDEGWLSGGERLALTRLPHEDRPVAVTRSWTQKEAVLKARGTGLTDDPAATVTDVGRATGVVAGWHVQEVPVPRPWIASLAVGPRKEISA